MVDFPEGYGFRPGYKGVPLQEHFSVNIGVFEWVGPTFGKRRSPYAFTPIGCVRKMSSTTPIQGVLYAGSSIALPPIEGMLQQVVMAMCTVHRMTGDKT
jgi:hypothetical protein